MPSGIVILAAYNHEDQFLVGNPELSHFRSVYKHHRPFATEFRKLSFDTRATLGQDNITINLPRDGDLIKKIYLRASFPTPPSDYEWTNNLGHALIKETRFRVGDTILDRQTGEWMNIWGNLTTPASKKDAYNDLVGSDMALVSLSGQQELYIPLQFWFCRHEHTAFPLISVQAQDTRLEIDTRPLYQLLIPAPDCDTHISLGDVMELSLLVEYVYLDRDEARWFVNRPQVYLIEQVQQDLNNEFCGGANLIRKELTFNGLMKEIYFVTRYRIRDFENLWFYYTRQEPGVYGGGGPLPAIPGYIPESQHGDIIRTARIQYESYDIVPELPAKFFRILQPYQHHTSVPDDFIYCYSWALSPEQWNPSGHINTFRSSNMTLILRKEPITVEYPTTLHTYSLIYNFLKINEGVCGLEFAYA